MKHPSQMELFVAQPHRQATPLCEVVVIRDEGTWLTLGAIAKESRFSKMTWLNWARDGKVKARRVGERGWQIELQSAKQLDPSITTPARVIPSLNLREWEPTTVVATAAHVDESTVARWARKGYVRARRIGLSAWEIHVPSLECHLEPYNHLK